jgi:aerobic carbon-monoxide dehydrogenase medium subunit
MLRPFALHRPSSLGDLAELLDAHHGEAALYAGGTELLLLMKEGLLRPQHLSDVKRVAGLDAITAGPDGAITIGAAVVHRAVETSPLVRERIPLLAGVAHHVANARVRAVGTVGGNLVFADPHSDLATLFLTLEAAVRLWSRGGERMLPLGEFVRDAYETARHEDEVLTAVRLRPWPAGTATVYLKFGIHERPTLGVAVALVPGGSGAVRLRLAVGCVGPRPRRLTEIEGQAGTDSPAGLAARADELASGAAQIIDPVDDRHGSAAYKREMTRVFVRRAVQAAVARAEGRAPHPRYAYTVVV